jgi:small conductance mechanosensitive channel
MLTLMPLLRNVLRVTIAVIASLIVLSEIGINIGPLLAGAGVAGLAIGFGAQKLVQDVINGMFIIIEDTVAVGDVVRVAGHIGLCEGLTIRTITLRDLSGTVHTVPFSDVTTVENLTKEFSFAVMDVGVAYREDTDAVIEILHQVAEELRAEPEYGAVMLEPLEVLGVDQFADSAVVIKVRIKTLPIKQWMVKREFNRRMKKAFDANGIEIPFPHATLYFGEDKQGDAPPAQVVLRERFVQSDSADDARDPAPPPVSAAQAGRGPPTDLPE